MNESENASNNILQGPWKKTKKVKTKVKTQKRNIKKVLRIFDIIIKLVRVKDESKFWKR